MRAEQAVDPPAPPAPPQPKIEVVVTPAPPKTSTTTSQATLGGNIQKLEVVTNSGDVNIVGVAGLTQIEAHAKNGTLEATNTNGVARIVAHGNLEDPTEIGWLNTVIKTIGRALPVDLEVRVPQNLAHLSVNLVAGDLDVIGIQGHVDIDISAGDVTLEGATSFMVNAKAGDIKIKTKLENGESSVRALAGDVNVDLLPGSSVALKASTTAGDVSARGFILTQTEKKLVGGSLEGRLGAARAKLSCSLTAGDLDIVAIDGTSQ